MLSPLCLQSTVLVMTVDTVICSIELLGTQGYIDGMLAQKAEPVSVIFLLRMIKQLGEHPHREICLVSWF